MTITLLRASDRGVTPWRNGGGTTREIAISPHGALLTAFDWRISMAVISGISPFSVFPGVDRILTVIGGTLDLAIDGRAAITLSAGAPPCRFAGEDICVGTALTQTVTDLNVMTRRAAFCAAVRHCQTETLQLAAEISVLFATEPCEAVLCAQHWRLAMHDALLLMNEQPASVAMTGKTLFIELQHVS